MEFIDAILHPLEVGVAWIMVAFHRALSTLGLPESSGWTWALSIVGLVILIRILLIPLFVKQIKASRGLQMIQPDIKKIQEKYKGKTDTASRQAMTQETMALYRERGTNPFSSCLPLLLQSPIFFALFRVLNGIGNVANGKKAAIGPFDAELAHSANTSTLLGSPLSDKFVGADNLSTQILTVVLIVLMSVTTFTTQRQLMMKNMPAAALDNPFAQQQKILLYLLPLIFAISGVNFPIGVLIYWLTTNVWSMGQQFYVIRRMPAPGSPAEKALEERKSRRGGKAAPIGPAAGAGDRAATTASGAATHEPGSGGPVRESPSVGGQRKQPKRQQSRSKRSGSRRPHPGGSARGSERASADGVE
jgi:YidC/Oxa1 family membrane protein insertase